MVHVHVFDPVFLLPGFRLRPSAGRQRCQRRPGSRSRRPGRLQRSGGHPDVLVSGRRQYSAYDSDTSLRRSRRQRLSRSLDVPQRRDQVDDKQADAAVLPAWSPERAFRKPTVLRHAVVQRGERLGFSPCWRRVRRGERCRWSPASLRRSPIVASPRGSPATAPVGPRATGRSEGRCG